MIDTGRYKINLIPQWRPRLAGRGPGHLAFAQMILGKYGLTSPAFWRSVELVYQSGQGPGVFGDTVLQQLALSLKLQVTQPPALSVPKPLAPTGAPKELVWEKPGRQTMLSSSEILQRFREYLRPAPASRPYGAGAGTGQPLDRAAAVIERIQNIMAQRIILSHLGAMAGHQPSGAAERTALTPAGRGEYQRPVSREIHRDYSQVVYQTPFVTPAGRGYQALPAAAAAFDRPLYTALNSVSSFIYRKIEDDISQPQAGYLGKLETGLAERIIIKQFHRITRLLQPGDRVQRQPEMVWLQQVLTRSGYWEAGPFRAGAVDLEVSGEGEYKHWPILNPPARNLVRSISQEQTGVETTAGLPTVQVYRLQHFSSYPGWNQIDLYYPRTIQQTGREPERMSRLPAAEIVYQVQPINRDVFNRTLVFNQPAYLNQFLRQVGEALHTVTREVQMPLPSLLAHQAGRSREVLRQRERTATGADSPQYASYGQNTGPGGYHLGSRSESVQMIQRQPGEAGENEKAAAADQRAGSTKDSIQTVRLAERIIMNQVSRLAGMLQPRFLARSGSGTFRRDRVIQLKRDGAEPTHDRQAASPLSYSQSFYSNWNHIDLYYPQPAQPAGRKAGMTSPLTAGRQSYQELSFLGFLKQEPAYYELFLNRNSRDGVGAIAPRPSAPAIENTFNRFLINQELYNRTLVSNQPAYLNQFLIQTGEVLRTIVQETKRPMLNVLAGELGLSREPLRLRERGIVLPIGHDLPGAGWGPRYHASLIYYQPGMMNDGRAASTTAAAVRAERPMVEAGYRETRLAERIIINQANRLSGMLQPMLKVLTGGPGPSREASWQRQRGADVPAGRNLKGTDGYYPRRQHHELLIYYQPGTITDGGTASTAAAAVRAERPTVEAGYRETRLAERIIINQANRLTGMLQPLFTTWSEPRTAGTGKVVQLKGLQTLDSSVSAGQRVTDAAPAYHLMPARYQEYQKLAGKIERAADRVHAAAGSSPAVRTTLLAFDYPVRDYYISTSPQLYHLQTAGQAGGDGFYRTLPSGERTVHSNLNNQTFLRKTLAFNQTAYINQFLQQAGEALHTIIRGGDHLLASRLSSQRIINRPMTLLRPGSSGSSSAGFWEAAAGGFSKTMPATTPMVHQREPGRAERSETAAVSPHEKVGPAAPRVYREIQNVEQRLSSKRDQVSQVIQTKVSTAASTAAADRSAGLPAGMPQPVPGTASPVSWTASAGSRMGSNILQHRTVFLHLDRIGQGKLSGAVSRWQPGASSVSQPGRETKLANLPLSLHQQPGKGDDRTPAPLKMALNIAEWAKPASSQYAYFRPEVPLDYRLDSSPARKSGPGYTPTESPVRQVVQAETQIEQPKFSTSPELSGVSIKRIADRIYRELEQRFKYDRQRRGMM